MPLCVIACLSIGNKSCALLGGVSVSGWFSLRGNAVGPPLAWLLPERRVLINWPVRLSVAEVDSVVGAFMLVRGEILRTVGLLDEAFFMYGEDLDWALRIKRAGWKVLYNGTVSVYHLKRASSRQRSTQSLIAFYDAMLIFFLKHYAGQTAVPLRWLVVLAIYLRAAVALAQNGSSPRELTRLHAAH